MIEYGAAQLAAAFRTVRGNTIMIAEEIPESEYGFVPAPGSKSVAQLLAHIAVSPRLQYDMHAVRRLVNFDGYDFFAIRSQLEEEEAHPRSKDALIALLKDEGERIATWLESLDDAFLAETVAQRGGGHRTRFEGLLAMKEHEMHHRGQLMLIQRMRGIVPHLTRTMNARRESIRQSAQPAG